MTDWDLVVERIQAAMQAVNESQDESKKTLLQEADREVIEAFRVKMEEIAVRLKVLLDVLNNENEYSMNELYLLTPYRIG